MVKFVFFCTCRNELFHLNEKDLDINFKIHINHFYRLKNKTSIFVKWNALKHKVYVIEQNVRCSNCNKSLGSKNSFFSKKVRLHLPNLVYNQKNGVFDNVYQIFV